MTGRDATAFFVGHEPGEEHAPLTIEPGDLTTHAVILGMTGSGKTGLGIDLLEEALPGDVPCLIIDPKRRHGQPAADLPGAAAG